MDDPYHHDPHHEQFADGCVAFCKQISDCTPGKRALSKQSDDEEVMMIWKYYDGDHDDHDDGLNNMEIMT